MRTGFTITEVEVGTSMVTGQEVLNLLFDPSLHTRWDLTSLRLVGGDITAINPEAIKTFISKQKKLQTLKLAYANMDLKSLKAIFEGLIIATEGKKEEDLLNEARCIEIDLSDVNTSQALYSDEAR